MERVGKLAHFKAEYFLQQHADLLENILNSELKAAFVYFTAADTMQSMITMIRHRSCYSGKTVGYPL